MIWGNPYLSKWMPALESLPVSYPLYAYFALIGLSMTFVGLLTSQIRKFAIKKRIYDFPKSSHKTHSSPVPYLGGVSIIIGVTFFSIAGTAVIAPSEVDLILAVLLPSIFLGAVGLIDDLLGLEPLPRLVAQTLVGSSVAMILIKTDTVGSPTGSNVADVLITILFIVGLSNSINFFDNVDGGASGAVAIATAVLTLLAFQSNQLYIAAIAALISGSTLGFLWWNKSPARIYMGDAGSLFLGSLLGSVLVRFEPNPITFASSYFVPIFLVAIPILDTTVVIVSRMLSGISPFKGGRDHLSHRLMRLGWSKIRTVLTLWILVLIFGLLSLALSNVSYSHEREIVALGSCFWLVLFLIFMRIPSRDAESIHQHRK